MIDRKYNHKLAISNILRKGSLFIFLTLTFIFLTLFSYSNNILVSNVITTGKNTTSHYTMIQFDVSWDNSWKTSTLESNWDAAWVFVKWKLASSNVWNHATLNVGGHTAPTGSTIDTPSDGKGVFMYKNANGIGSNNWINAQLRWNYGADGISDNDSVEVCLFAIEMVYVPSSAFYVGDGTATSIAGQFQSGTTNTPFQITSEASITLGGNTAGNLRNNNATGMWNADDFNNTITQTLPLAFPKGFNSYYVMKYEITQEQYVEFLNKLTRTQQASRMMTTNVGNYMGDVITYTTPQYRNGIKLMSDPGGLNPRVYGNDLNNNGTAGEVVDGQNIACNYISWADLAAYLDWAALRPMTELEYEKACRGNQTPVANEYAWGNTTITGTTGISNSGLTNETASNVGANCASNGTLGGPMRVGNFAQTGTTRQQSGGSYYGIMELSGNNWERAVTVGNVIGRSFTGINGDGNLLAIGNANVVNWAASNSTGIGYKGGIWGNNIPLCLRVSDRGNISSNADSLRYGNGGGRGVRTFCIIPSVPTASTHTPSQTQIVWNWNTVSGATGYQWSTTSTYPGAGVNVISSPTYTQTGLTCNTAYTIYVWAYNACGNSIVTTLTQTTSACSSCGSPITDVRDGQLYNTVLIGSQCWMAQNLNYGTYVAVANGGQVGVGTQKYCTNYSFVNDPTCPIGGLYEWDEMMNGSVSCNGTGLPPNDRCVTLVQGICPAGWHIPSQYEWTTLEKNIGSNPGAFPYDVTTVAWLGTNEGGNLKETGITHWLNPNTGATNSTGFTAIPSGLSWSGSFMAVDEDSNLWSSTEIGGNAWNRWLNYNTSQMSHEYNDKACGFSVRCIKD